MVSAFASDMDLFTNDTTLPNELFPRLQNQSTSQLVSLQEAVIRMVIGPARKPMIDWQSIAEMFVQRYATPSQHLISPGLSDADFKFELQTLLQPFISDSANDTGLIARRCVDQFCRYTGKIHWLAKPCSKLGIKSAPLSPHIF